MSSEGEKKYPERPEEGHFGIVAEFGKMKPLFAPMGEAWPTKEETKEDNGKS